MLESHAWGQTSDSQRWLSEIERVREQLDAEQLPDLDQAESDLLAEIDRTRAYFARSTNPDNYQAWMRYLKLKPLTQAIEENDSIADRGRTALAILSHMRGVETGLELPAMLALRDSLDQYVLALRYSDPKRGLALIGRQLDRIAELVSPDSKPLGELSPDQTDELELSLISLVEIGQANELASEIRSRFSQPNVQLWIDGKAFTDTVTRPVNNPSNVNECILGTRISGRAVVNGFVTAQLIPQDGYVRMVLRLDGQLSTSTRGYRKPITLESTGSGPVYAARQIAITQKRIILGETIATADLSTTINRINHPLRIVRKIAMRKARESKPQAERISQRRLTDRLRSEFSDETAESADRQFPDLDAKIQPWLRRLDFPELEREIGSTDRNVYVRAKLQRPSGFSAPNSPPSPAVVSGTGSHFVSPAVANRALATIQFHQSIAGNTVGRLLAGETFSPQRINRITEVLKFEFPPRVDATDPKVDVDQSQESSEGFEIDFANFRPVYVEADNQILRLGIRGTRFSQGDRELKVPIEASAVYRPVTDANDQSWLVRDEKVHLSFSGSTRLSLSQTAVKANVEDSFDKLFPKEILHRDFVFPDDVGMPALAGRVVKVQSIDLTNGWISITVH